MSRSPTPRLAVILPTYRYDAAAKQALRMAASVGCEDIRVHIGDNSANPEKHAFLRDLEARSVNVSVTCHPENIGAELNWLQLVRAQTASFISLACDDDSFARGYFSAGSDLLSQDAGCSAASGLLLSIAEEPGRDVPSLYSPPERREDDPLQRIARYNNQNAIAYAVTRREAIFDFADYVEANPLKNAFNDYLLAFHLLSMGTYRLDRRGQVYVYDNDNWHLPQAAFRTSAKFYVGCGLPEGFAHLARLHWAIANLHFFRSRFRSPSLSATEAERIATYLFDRLMQDFRKEFRANKVAIALLLAGKREAYDAVIELAKRRRADRPDVLRRFATVVSAFSPHIAARYLTFLEETLVDAPTLREPHPSKKRLRDWIGF